MTGTVSLGAHVIYLFVQKKKKSNASVTSAIYAVCFDCFLCNHNLYIAESPVADDVSEAHPPRKRLILKYEYSWVRKHEKNAYIAISGTERKNSRCRSSPDATFHSITASLRHELCYGLEALEVLFQVVLDNALGVTRQKHHNGYVMTSQKCRDLLRAADVVFN